MFLFDKYRPIRIDDFMFNENIMEQKLNALYDQLLNHSKEMSITEYSQKRAIFEFLKRLDDDGKGKMEASKEAICPR